MSGSPQMDSQRRKTYDDLDAVEKHTVDQHLSIVMAQWVEGQYDFCIIHSDDDLDEVEKFRDEFCERYQLAGIIESDAEMLKIADNFSRMEEMVKRSTRIFLYITEGFSKDFMCLLQRSELLAKYVNKAKTTGVHIIPVYPRKECLQWPPSGVSGLTGLKVFNPNRDEKRVRQTFNEVVRKQKQIRQELDEPKLRRRMLKARQKIIDEEINDLDDFERWRRDSTASTASTLSSMSGLSEAVSTPECDSPQMNSFQNEEAARSVHSAGSVYSAGSVPSTEMQQNVLIKKTENASIGHTINVYVGEQSHLHLSPNLISNIATSSENIQDDLKKLDIKIHPTRNE